MPGLAKILPATVAVANCYGEDFPEGDLGLYLGEQASTARAVPKRRREFIVARSCARQALRRLGAPVGAIPKGPGGEPQWPSEVVGSITHCAGYAAAAVAWRVHLLALGIDAEPNEPLPDGVLELTASATEIAHLDSLTFADPAVSWGRLLFCAKEAVYKAWYPVQRRWLGFEDVEVHLSPEGWFDARLLAPTPDDGPFARCAGKWSIDEGLLLAALSLPAAGSAVSHADS